MNTKHLWSVILCLFVAACLSVSGTLLLAQEPNGGLPQAFLLRDVSARAIGLSGAFTAVANDPTAVYYNPAGLAYTSHRPQIYSMASAMGYGRQHNFLAYGQTLFEDFGVGACINNFSPGIIDVRNRAGEPLGNVRSQQLSAQAAVAYKYRSVSLGIGGKYILNALGNIPTIGYAPRGDGWGLDVGMKIQMFDLFSFAASAQNIAGEMKWNSPNSLTEGLPYTIRLGLATEIGFNKHEYTVRSTTRGQEQTIQKEATSYILASVEAVYVEGDAQPNILLGVEAAPFQEFVLRGGFSVFSPDLTRDPFLNFNRYSFGVSVRPIVPDLPFRFSLDYAVAHDALIRNQLSHHFSVLIEL